MRLKSILKPALSWTQRTVHPWLRYLWHRTQNNYLEARHNLILNCLGDSHNAVFQCIQKEYPIPGIFIRCTTIIGATVLGLANPNSKTNAMPIITREIRALPKQQALCIMLGEVDCGFLIFLRSQRKGTLVSDEMDESLRRYRDFLAPLPELGLEKTIICSVPPPTIADHNQLGSVANLRREVSASIEEKTELTRKYNADLKQITEHLGFIFLDMDELFIDERTGIVRQELLNPDPRDHHLDPNRVAPLYADTLRKSLALHASVPTR